MVMVNKEPFEDDKSTVEERIVVSTPFLPHQAPEEEMELSLVDTADVSEPYKHCKPQKIQFLKLQYSPDSKPTYEILFENIIVEYKSFAHQESEFKYEDSLLKVAYLKTYVSIGIPTGRYKWLLRNMSTLSGVNFSGTYHYQDDNYTWLSAQLPNNSAVYEEVKCYVYDSKVGSTVPVGTLRDVLTGMKSNLLGYGKFCVRKINNFQNRPMVSLFLTAFQIIAKTDNQSRPKPCVPISATPDVLESLKTLNLDSK